MGDRYISEPSYLPLEAKFGKGLRFFDFIEETIFKILGYQSQKNFYFKMEAWSGTPESYQHLFVSFKKFYFKQNISANLSL